jgi:dihydrolipoamide dehydrogenase
VTAAASFHGRGASGTTRFVVDTDREVLIGATFVGPEIAESLRAATIAIVFQGPAAHPRARCAGLPDAQRAVAQVP